MPNLPTIAINNSTTWSRLLAAFNSDPDAYKAWLIEQLRLKVQNYEVESVAGQRAKEIKTALDAEWTRPVP